MSAAFFDTNIIVYAVDPRDASQVKREASRQLMLSRDCMLSTQVLLETFNVLMRLQLVERQHAEAYIRRLGTNPVLATEADDVLQALEIAARFKVSHWDALILRGAEKAGVSVIYTEDLSHGQTYGKVRVCNPFIEDFLA